MPSEPRHHHYIPQCYLRGFTVDGHKNSMLGVLDYERKRLFHTRPRNVGGERDFNRIEIEGLEPSSLEMSMAQFEGGVAAAITSLEASGEFEGEDKVYILNLLALLNVRSPQQRENWREFRQHTAEIIMDVATSSRETWESQLRQMIDAGTEVNEDVTYEDARDFLDRGEYTVEISREYQIRREFLGQDIVLRTLMQRNWALLVANKESGHFITSDNPAMLMWRNPGEVPPLYRHSPGHGHTDSEIYFPISKNLALTGAYDGHVGTYQCTRDVAAACNSGIVGYAYKQLYFADEAYCVLDRDGDLADGRYIINEVLREE